jgi:hypothetical protein
MCLIVALLWHFLRYFHAPNRKVFVCSPPKLSIFRVAP